MLHRIGVTRAPAVESKKQQNKDSEIKKAGSDGDIVDSSADSPPSLKARTHSVSTAATTEPSTEPRPAWKALGRQLPAEPPGTSSDQPQHSLILAEPSGAWLEPGGQEGWSSSLPRLRQDAAGEPSTQHWGLPGCQGAAGSPQWDLPAAFPDNRLMARLAAPRGPGRRAMSVHEEQLREPECPAELGVGTVPLRLRRSPVLRHRTKHDSLSEVEAEPGPSSDAEG
ncbi:Leucine-rich repeat-containing protein 16C, partial [Acanthisitta chloris]